MRENTAQHDLVFGGIGMRVLALKSFLYEKDSAEKRLGGAGVSQKDSLPYYGIIWESARSLCEVLASRRDLSGKRILEVGCGLALPSILAARLGAEVTATDFHPDAGDFFRENLRLNGLEGSEKISFRQSSWDGLADLASRSDLVLGTDIIYEEDKTRSLVQFLKKSISGGLPEAVVVDADGRPHFWLFEKLCLEAGLSLKKERREVAARFGCGMVGTTIVTVTK